MSAIIYFLALAIGPLSAVVFWLGFSWRGPSREKVWAKFLPMGILYVWLWVFSDDVGSSVIPWVVLFAWFGDVWLARGDDRSLVWGMACFSVVHLFLIWMFVERGVSLEALDWRYASVIILAAAAIGALMMRRAEGLQLRLLIYVPIITIMGLFGFAIDSGSTEVDEAIRLAAALFVVSSCVIAFEMFVLPEKSVLRRRLGLVSWPLYYVAMVLFASASVG